MSAPTSRSMRIPATLRRENGSMKSTQQSQLMPANSLRSMPRCGAAGERLKHAHAQAAQKADRAAAPELGREPINLQGVRLARVRYAPIMTKLRNAAKCRDGPKADSCTAAKVLHSITPSVRLAVLGSFGTPNAKIIPGVAAPNKGCPSIFAGVQ
jgi:hypothetical protein